MNDPGRIIKPEPAPDKDKRSSEEEDALYAEHKIDRERKEHGREQRSRSIMMYGVWALMVVLFAIAVSAVFSLGWHTLLPEKWHWLTDEQFQDIKSFVLSGAIVGLSTTFLKRYLEPLPKM